MEAFEKLERTKLHLRGDCGQNVIAVLNAQVGGWRWFENALMHRQCGVVCHVSDEFGRESVSSE